jgi:hypothetical protein
MRRTTLTRCGFIIGFLISLPLVVSAEDNPTASSSLAKEVKEQKAQVTKILLYQPPRGRPFSRSASGRRNTRDKQVCPDSVRAGARAYRLNRT